MTIEHTYNRDYEVEILIRLQNTLIDAIPVEYRSPEYQVILENIQLYLRDHCRHILVYDHIDIDGDTTQQICYCERCHMTVR